jgi:hypothetical protein
MQISTLKAMRSVDSKDTNEHATNQLMINLLTTNQHTTDQLVINLQTTNEHATD